MSASDSSTSRMAPLATLPDVADHSVGDMVNVKGALYVLTAAPRTNEFQGTAGSAPDGYLGTIVVGNERVGSFLDPAAKGEVTWFDSTKTRGSNALVRLRIVSAAFADDEQLPKLYVRITDQLGRGSIVATLTRDSGRTNTTVYAWSTADGDTMVTQAGQYFTAIVCSDSKMKEPVYVDEPGSNVWKRWLGHELPTIGDVGDVAERQKIRDAINTETKLRAGPGIEIGIPKEGKRTVAVANPQGIGGRALGAADAFSQRALDQKKPWRIEAIEQGAPVFVKLCNSDASQEVYNSEDPLRIDDTVTAAIKYTRLPTTPNSSPTLPDRGKFIITITPNSAARTLKDLFPNGTVTHFTIRLGTTKDEAKLGQLLRLPVEKVVDTTDTLKMRTTAIEPEQEDLLKRAAEVYAQVNFVVAGNDWRREPESDLTATGFEIGDITSDGTSLFAVNRDTFEVVAFTNGKKDPSKGLAADTVRAGIIGAHAVGLTTDGTNLYVLSDYRRLVAFTPNGERIHSVVTPEYGRNASALTYDGSHLLVGGIRNRRDGVGDRPRVRPFTTELIMIHGLPLHLGSPLEGVPLSKVGALAFADGVLYVGDSTTGRVHAFFEDGNRDETKEPPATMTVPNMSGMTVHNGRLYVAVGKAAKAFVIPRDRYAFSEGYHYTTLNRDDLRNAVYSAPEVTQLPPEPVPGQRVKLTAADRVPRSGILTAARNVAGDFAGYQSGAPPTGSLTGAPDEPITFLGSYTANSDGRFRDHAVLVPKSGSGKTPQAVWINRQRYAVSAWDRPFWRIEGANGSTFVAGSTYRVQVLWADGEMAFTEELPRGDYTRNVQRWVRSSVPGLTRVHEDTIGGDRGVLINNSSAAETPVSFTLFSPSFDLDLVAGGVLGGELELELTSPVTFGFDQSATPTYHGNSMATVGAIRRQAAYTTASARRVNGVAVAAAPIYDGTTELGVLRLYLARNASNELGYLLAYAPAKYQDGTAHRITITARLAVSYQPFL